MSCNCRKPGCEICGTKEPRDLVFLAITIFAPIITFLIWAAIAFQVIQ